MKVRDLLQQLERHGCVYVRTRGSHATYRLPNQTCITVIVKYQNADVSGNVMAAARRALRAAGIELDDRGATRGATRG